MKTPNPAVVLREAMELSSLTPSQQLFVCDCLADFAECCDPGPWFSEAIIESKPSPLRELMLWVNVLGTQGERVHCERFVRALNGRRWRHYSFETLLDLAADRADEFADVLAACLHPLDFATMRLPRSAWSRIRTLSERLQKCGRKQYEPMFRSGDDSGEALGFMPDWESFLPDPEFNLLSDEQLRRMSLGALLGDELATERSGLSFRDGRSVIGTSEHFAPTRDEQELWARIFFSSPASSLNELFLRTSILPPLARPFEQLWNEGLSADPELIDAIGTTVHGGLLIHSLSWGVHVGAVDFQSTCRCIGTLIDRGIPAKTLGGGFHALAKDGVDVVPIFLKLNERFGTEIAVDLFEGLLGEPRTFGALTTSALPPLVRASVVAASRSRCIALMLPLLAPVPELIFALGSSNHGARSCDELFMSLRKYHLKTIDDLVSGGALTQAEGTEVLAIVDHVVRTGQGADVALAPTLTQDYRARPLWDWLHHVR